MDISKCNAACYVPSTYDFGLHRRGRNMLINKSLRRELKRSLSAFDQRSTGFYKQQHQKSNPEKGRKNRAEQTTLQKHLTIKRSSTLRQTDRNNAKEINSFQHPAYKVYIHGYCGVGKTLLLQRLVSPCLENGFKFVKGDLHYENACVTADIDSQESVLHFTEIDVLRKGNFKDANVHLVVFSLHELSSMKYAVERITYLRWKCRIERPIIIVGSKADIVRSRPDFKNDLKFLSNKLNCFYIESSAIVNYNIGNIMSCITAHASCERVNCSERKKKIGFLTAVMTFIKFWKK